MTFAVLMSVYYKETSANLDRSINSIWYEQSLRPNQIIIVEDGPLTKELYQVIDKWKLILGDLLITPKNETNCGLTQSLNKGLEYVSCDLVARNDSDDYSASNRFALQVKFLEEHDQIDVLGGAMQEFNNENSCLSIRTYPSSNIEKYICRASPVAHPTVMMRMKILREGGLKYDSRYPLNEDIALWFDVLRNGYHISNIPDIIYHFNCNDGIYGRRSRKKAWPELKVYTRGIKDLHGVISYYYIFPLVRYVFRLMPIQIISRVYEGPLRRLFLHSRQ